MSFDVYLDKQPCSACHRAAETVYQFNLTHNVNEIVDRCFKAAGSPVAKSNGNSYPERSWGRLDGWTAADALPILEAALVVANDREREVEFRLLEPANGWGSLVYVREVMAQFRDACREHPDTTIRTWG